MGLSQARVTDPILFAYVSKHSRTLNTSVAAVVSRTAVLVYAIEFVLSTHAVLFRCWENFVLSG